jgi:hypothetical protein
MLRKFTCPEKGCGREAKLARRPRNYVELVPIPTPIAMKMKATDLQPRRPPMGVLMRTFLLECPQHGLRCFQEEGHHSSVPREQRVLRDLGRR